MRGWAGSPPVTPICQLWRTSSAAARLHRESNRLGLNLVAAVRAGPYLSITVTEASHVGIALAGAMVDAGRFEEAQVLLDDDALLDGPENHQWRQHIRGHLMFATQRWPDVIAEAARVLPAHALIMPAVTAGTAALAAHAAAHLGQARLALDWAERVEVRTRCDPGVSVGNDHRTSVAVLDPIEFPLIAADLAYARGMAHRQLDQQDEAEIWLSKAVVSGVPIPRPNWHWPIHGCNWSSPTRRPSTVGPTSGMRPPAARRKRGPRSATLSGGPNFSPRAVRCCTARSVLPRSSALSPDRGPDRGAGATTGTWTAGGEPDEPHAAGRATRHG